LPFRYRLLKLTTNQRVEIINITDMVEKTVRELGIVNGLCLVHAPHATAAVVLNEDEPNLKRDILKLAEKLTSGVWGHNAIDDNAEAHLASVLFGSTKILPIVGGRLVRGTWQEILFVELDGPRSERRVIVAAIGEEAP